MKLKSHAKFEEKQTCGLENDKEFSKFSSQYLKVSKLVFSWDPFVQSRKRMSYKFTEELKVISLKNDVKSEEELNCRYKLDIRNLTNFDARTRKSQKFTLSWAAFDPKVYNA